ncbi:MAG: hypothetical protein ACLFQR_00025 [Desulfovibrionales bacterium]
MFLRSKLRTLHARKMMLVDESDLHRDALRLQAGRFWEANAWVTQGLSIVATFFPLVKSLFRNNAWRGLLRSQDMDEAVTPDETPGC